MLVEKMVVGKTSSDGGSIEVIPLHFNVAEDHFPLGEFVDTAICVQTIIKAFNNDLFGGKLRYEILVPPSEPGTFKSRLAIWAFAAPAAIWVGLESDMGKAFVHGLTGHEPAYWVEQVGVEIGEAIESDGEDNTSRRNTCASIGE